MTITELAIKRPTLVVVVFSVLALLGIFGFNQLNYELMPKMTAPVITISTVYPGAAPYEVMNSVTKPIEDAITGMELISTIRSQSTEGISFVFVELDMSADVDKSLQDAQRRINQIRDLLPQNVRDPVISKISFEEVPVLRLTATSKLQSKEFYQFVNDNVLPRISKLPGVGLVQILGGEEREIKVYLDVKKIQSLNLGINSVVQTLKASNLDFPTGKIKESDNEYVIRVAGKFNSLEELENQIVAQSRTGGIIRLRDIAQITDGVKEITYINRLDGNPSLGIVIQKQSDANTVEVSKLVRKELKNLERDYANFDLQFLVAQDNSDFIMESANAVKKDIALAVIIVAAVMFIFLHSARNSLIVMVSIPTSLISTFFVMYIFGFTLNMMTLLAMSLVIGILVDDSIVVLENIARHLESGEDKVTAAIRGRNEIGFAALSITLVDVVVFVPMSLITGMIGNFLREYALVVVFSTLMSLFVSFTITPLLASRISRHEKPDLNRLLGKISAWIERLYRSLERNYAVALAWALRNRAKVFLIATMLFISSLMLPGLGFIGTEFVPNVDRGEIVFTIETSPGSTIEYTNEVALQIEEMLRKYPEVKRVYTNVGRSSEGILGFSQANSAEILAFLVDKNERKISTDDFAVMMKQKINEIPDVRVKAQPVTLLGTSGRTPIQILVSGPDYETTLSAAETIENIVRQTKGTSDVRLSTEQGKPEIRVDIDRDKLAKLGLTVFDIGAVLRVALTGDDDSKFTQGLTDYDIRIQLDEFDRSKVEEVENLPFTNRNGQQILLKQFARVYQSVGPTKLQRDNRSPAVYVNSLVFGRASGDVTNEIFKKLEKTKLPAGVSYELIGEQKSMRESFTSMILALFAGIIFVYLILVALYNSYLYPFVVLFSIPLAIIGAFYGLAFTMKTISVYSLLGLITLVGLVAKNGILLVDRAIYKQYSEGFAPFDALIEAGQMRLRPILMTTLSMVFGVMPIALATSAGSEAKSGLAIVIQGGLLSSMFLTLFVVPVVYLTVENIKTKLAKVKLFAKKSKELSTEMPD